MRPALVLLVAACAGGCGRPQDSHSGPTSVLLSHASYSPALMALGNPSGVDDDPSLIRALDGSYYLVFISDRTGNHDLWITSSGDGIAWTPPVQITGSPDEDLYPNLLQTEDGAYHLVWHRFEALTTGESHLYYRTTTTPLGWGPAETPITSGAVDDSDCKLLVVDSTELRVYFSSAARSTNPTYNRDIYVVRSLDRGRTWGAPVVSDVSHGTEFDRYPAVVRYGQGLFYMIFQRQKTNSIVDGTSDLFVADSPDGLAWDLPEQITSDGADDQPDLFSSFYRAPIFGRWMMSWTSPAFSTGGLVSRAVAGAPPVDMTPILGMGGWSMRVAPAPNGYSLLVFVSNPTGSPQLYSVILPI
jgi:hypothetical protein